MSQSDYIQRKRIATQISEITRSRPDIKETPPPVIIDVITDIKECALEKTVSNNPTYNILNAPNPATQDSSVITTHMGGQFLEFIPTVPINLREDSFSSFSNSPKLVFVCIQDGILDKRPDLNFFP